MKKARIGQTALAFALIMCITVLFTTCKNNIGLGGTVDIRPPTLNVLTIYPPAEAVIRDEFTLSIEAEDDSGIASVNANFTKTGITEQPDSAYTSFDLKKAEDGIHWTAKINTKKEDSSFPLPDGSYKVLLTATDTAGKTVRTESTLTIDNTAPLLILNRPSTTTADSSSDVFGDGFLLVGQVYDDTPVAALTVTAKGKGKSEPVFTKSIPNIPQNIRLTVDAFSSDEKQEFYQGLYGTTREAGAKDYEYGITVTDDAKVYKTPGDNGVGPGNTTDRYYLFDDLYSDVLSEHQIQTVYNMMRGTYSSVTEAGITRTAAQIEADKEKMKAVQAALKKVQLGGDNERKGTFALNPSINPQFDIAGEKPTAKPESGEPEFSRLYSDSTLTVKVSCNLDGIPLEGADTYRFFLMEWQKFSDFTGELAYPTAKINSDDIYADAAKKTVKPDFIELTKSKFEKEGSSYIFSVPVSAEGLTYGKRYVLLVRGKDQGEKGKPGNELIPDAKGVLGGVYGFTLRKTGKVPEVYVIKINQTVGQSPDSPITERVYLKKDEPLNFKMKLQQTAAKVTYTLRGAVGGDISKTEPYAVGEYDVTIEAAKFNQDADGTYKLTVKAEADEGTSLEQTYTIIYDVNGPEADITTLVNDAVINKTNGTAFSVSGTAFDTGSGLADVTVKLSKNDGNGTFTDRTLTVTTTDGRWTTAAVDLSNSTNYGEGKYTLKMTAKDKLGLSKELSRTFYYDEKAPVITPVVYDSNPNATNVPGINVGGTVITNGKTAYTKTASPAQLQISGWVHESYGIGIHEDNGTPSFTINGETITGVSTSTSTPDAQFTKLISFAEGQHADIAVTVKDKAGQASEDFKFTLVVDTKAPEFETSTALPADQIQFAGQRASGVSSDGVILTSNNPLKVTGLIKDPVSGGTASRIKEVQYVVTEKTVTTAPSTGWQQLNGTHESNGNYRLNGFVQVDGEKKVWIKAVDNADNETVFSHEVKVVPAAVITWTLELENNSPSGTVKYNAGTWYAKGQFKVKIGGTLNSAPTGGSPITVEIKRGSDPITPLTDFFGDWTGREAKILPPSSPNTYTYTVKSGQTEGEYTIKISAQGQEKLLTFTIDGTVPTITLDPSVPADDNKWVNTKALSVSGTAADATSGIEKIEASVNGTEKLLGTDASWSGYLTLNEGDNTVQFKVTDKAGNTASTPTPPRTIKLDTGRPTITLTAPANGQALIKDSNYTVKVTTNDVESGIARVEYATTVGFASLQSVTPIGGSATINLTGINGDTTYYFRAVDNAGNPSDSVWVTIQKDNAPPTITFDSPQDSQTVNKKITIKGSASDNKELKSVKIVKGDGTNLANGSVSASSGADSSKAEFSGINAYNWQFDLDTNRPEYPNGTLTLKAIATDAAGNTTEKTLTLNVDQDSDRPQIVITNLTALNAAGTYLTTNTLNFVIIDDDGEIEDGKFEITSVPSAAGTLTKTVSGWQYTFAEDGEKTLKFKVTDKKGGVFETEATDKPRVYAKDTTTTVSNAPVKLKVDTKPPQSETPALQFSNASDYSGLNNLEQNAKFNGGMLYLQIMASDASGIRSVTGKIDNVTSTPVQQNVDGAANGHPEKWRIKLDLSTVAEGVKTLTIELTDKAGANSQFTRGIIVDKTAPTVALTYPDPTDPQAGEITVSGTIVDDGAGVNPDKTKYILGKKTPAPTVSTPDYHATTAPHGWKPMNTSTKGSWTVELNLDTVPSTEYGNAVGLYKEIPLYIFTEDEIGNKQVHEKKILFDPDGTKPIVKILSPQNTTPATKLGGTIQIFGTASVPKGGPAAVGEVYIQFSHNGTFANDTDGTFGTVNWYNSGNGQLISGTDTNGGADWRISINGDGSFNHATNQNQDVYFRVRAKNKNGLSTGQWTEKIKIIVDKSAPTIGSPNAVKVDDSSSTAIAGGPNAKDYTPNMWVGRNKKLIGSLKDDSGIKAVHITSTGLAGGVSYNLSQAQTAGWIAPVTGGNYELQIPFDLDALSDAAKKAGEFSVTVSITENTETPALSTQQTFTFRFDTTDPIGDFGTDKYMNIGNFTSSSITDAQLAQKVKDLGATTSSGGGCKILADNHILTVTKVTGDKIEFTASPALTAGSHSYILYKPETLIYKNSSGKWIVNGVANDSGSGVTEVKAWVSVETDPVLHTVIKSPETVINETDTANRITKQLGGTVTWKGLVDFGSVPDGKGKLHYTITDKSGNTYTTPGVDVVVKNKPVEVTKVTLKTKIGGIDVETDKPGATETDPKTVVTEDTNDAQLNQTKAVESKNFAFKSTTDSKIKVEFSGGQGTVKYRLRKSDGTMLQDLTAVTSGSEIDLTTHFGTGSNKINNSNGTPTTIKLELWDEAHGYTQGTDSAWAKVDITTLFDALDTKPPTVVILPFHWNSETDNSLYQNSRANGHVEIDSSSVSGKVTLRGFAYDNVQLKTLTATLPNASGITVTNTANNWSIGEDTSKNIKFEVEESKYDYLGYYVKWKLEWDSEKTSVGLGKTISVSAHDGTNSSGTSAADPSSSSSSLTRDTNDTAEHADFAVAKPGQFILFTKGEAQHLTRVKSVTGNKIELINAVDTDFVTATLYKDTTNKPSISINVVPYITSVSRNSTYNTNRARSGAIPLLRGEAGNTVTGFNFATGSETSLKITEKKDGTGSSVATENLTLSGSSFTFKVPDTAKDGYLHLVVNGVAAVNNINAYTASNMEDSDTYGTAKHSDDRFVHIWRVSKEDTFKGSKNAIYPAMSKGTGGTLYASFSNYSKAEVYYSSEFTGDPDPDHSPEVGGTGTTTLFTGYDPPEETDITVNGTEVNVLYAANYHGGQDFHWGDGSSAFPWNDTLPKNAGGVYLYDKDAPQIEVGQYQPYVRAYRFELFTYDNELQQFKNIRTVRFGNNIYVVYYDRLTGAVKFAWVDDSKKPSTSLKALPWCVIDGNTDITDRECKVPDHLVNTAVPPDPPNNIFTFVNPDGSSAVAKPYILSNFEDELSVSNAVWESIAVATTKSGYPIVVYMDSATGGLRLARSTKKQPTLPTDWKIQKVLASSDKNGKNASDYINACIGSDGILHIAFQNTKGELVYVKSTNTSDDGLTKYTFGESEVLDDSGMSIDMTINGTIPYITYVSRPNSYDAIRIAYKTSMDFNNTGTNVEGWETMTAPLNERAANSRICIETQAKHYNATGTMPVAVGFKTNSDYRAAFYVGE